MNNYDSGLRRYTDSNTQCWGGLGVCRVTTVSSVQRVAPPRWYRSIESFYVGFHGVSGTLGDKNLLGARSRTNAYALTVGAGVTYPAGRVQTFFEVELQRYLTRFENRSPWGLRARVGASVGPVYFDAIWLADSTVGGELSAGLGLVFRTR